MASVSAVYMCALCDSTFTSKDIYRQHMDKVHQTPLAGEAIPPSTKPKITILDVDEPSVPLICVSDAESTGIEEIDVIAGKSAENRGVRSKDRNTTDVSNPRSERNSRSNSETRQSGLESALPVECGPNKAWLCLKRLSQARKVDRRQSGKCIFFSDEWLTPSDFIETSIRASLVEWQEFIYHNNRTFKWLLDNQVVSLSPPACQCDSCKQIKTQAVSPTSEKKDPTKLATDETMVKNKVVEDASKAVQKTSLSDTTEADGRPPGAELALAIQCGSNKAWLCIGRLRDTAEKSIYFDGRWLSPAAFAEESELGWLHNWKLATKHHGSTVFSLLNDKILTISPPMCRCKFCKPNQSDSSPSTSVASDEDVDLEVSDHEDDEAAAIMAEAGTMLPEEYEVRGALWVLRVECGPNTAWMCIGLLSQIKHEREKQCVLYEGRWLTPNKFMHVSGRGTLRAWKMAIRHHNKSLETLFRNETITISPPACQCDMCKDGSSRAQRYLCTFCSNTFSTEDTCMTHIAKTHPSEKLTTESTQKGTKMKQASNTDTTKDEGKKAQSAGQNVATENVASTSRKTRHTDQVSTIPVKSNISKDLINEYGTYPPEKDGLLPVECGSKKGWLDLSCLVQSSTATLGKSVYHAGEWHHVQKFRKIAGKEAQGSWMADVRHYSKTILSLLKSNTIIISTCSCSCNKCAGKPDQQHEYQGRSEKALPPTPSSKAELVRIYGEYPPEEDSALPVECGPKKGWLCLKYVDQINPHNTGECIYSSGKWYTRGQFKKLGGYEHRSDWKLSISHYGKMINGLLKNQTLITSPPSCSCQNCIAAGRGDLQINTSRTYVDDKLFWLYGEGPPDVEYVLPIECGPQKGWLCLEYIDESPASSGECIYSYGEWYTRGQFKTFGGYDQRGNWRLYFKHFGLSLHSLLKDAILTLSPPSCKCNNCSGNETEDFSPPQLQEKEESLSEAAPMRISAEAKKPNKTVLTKYINEELVKEYGERPPNQDFALPIECASNRGWLCIQLFNMSEPAKTGECVYSSGKWYKRNQFKKYSGYQDDNWKFVFKHFGKTFWDLENRNMLSISPPSCQCTNCLVNDPEVESSSESLPVAASMTTTISSDAKKPELSSGYTIDELVKEYGEQPPNEDYALPIECGSNRGWMCIQNFDASNPGKTGQCIYSSGKWYGRNEFKKLSGYSDGNYWKRIFRHFGQIYSEMETNNLLTFSPPSCRCNKCSVHQEGHTVVVTTNQLVKEYGEVPHDVKHTLPIECGYEKGWLCMEFINESDPSKTGECIYSQGKWYTCQQFKKKCGYQDSDVWEQVIRHFGETFKSLIDYNILALSPPCCSCLQCSRSGSVNEPTPSTSRKPQEAKNRIAQSSTRQATDTTDDLVNTYGERPPDGEYALPVECGQMTGWLCLEYINRSDPMRTGECIYSYGDWYTRNQFKIHGGYKMHDNWSTTIKHFGQSINRLERHNLVTFTPPSCSCTKCALQETPDGGVIQEPKPAAYKASTIVAGDKLVKKYGERPPSGEYGLPVEAGSMRGWLCLEYINEESPKLTGACIYSHGTWYTRSNFKNLGGCQGQPSWQLAVKHFGRDYKSLVENYIVTLSPPSCSCDRCVGNQPEDIVPSTSSEPTESQFQTGLSSHSIAGQLKPYISYDEDFLKEYGEGPPGEEYLLPVECGDLRGWLCMQYIHEQFASAEHEVIYSNGKWHTVVDFKDQSGSKTHNWQMSIMHHGHFLGILKRKNKLTFSPPSCICELCSCDSSEAIGETYGERPEDAEFALPIECGTRKGWLCLEFVDKSVPGMAGECIYSHGQWYRRNSFKKHGGYEYGSWDAVIRHYGQTMKALLDIGIVTLSPASCSCLKCAGNVSMVETELSDVFEEPAPKRARTSVESSKVFASKSTRQGITSGHAAEELVQEYGECPPDEEFALPIECGSERGWFCLQYVNESSPQATGECIYSHGNWYNRRQFMKQGAPSLESWKRAFSHFGKSLLRLLSDNTITISPPSCCCVRCTNEGSIVETQLSEVLEEPTAKRTSVSYGDVSSTATSREQIPHGHTAEKLIQEYGERPPDEDFALPIECGEERGWLCLQYFNESSPTTTGECVYSQGHWYTRGAFMMRGTPHKNSWSRAFKHFGKGIFPLLGKRILTISPPSCRCVHCTAEGMVIETEVGNPLPKRARSSADHSEVHSNRGSMERASFRYTDEELGQEYGERPPDAGFALPVECGPERGWLCLKDYNEASHSKCVYSRGNWYKRGQFMKLGHPNGTSWKQYVMHFGKSFKCLEGNNIISLSPPSCRCAYCTDTVASSSSRVDIVPSEKRGRMSFEEAETLATSLSQGDLTVTYGERPPDEHYTLPIECGPKKGWLCLQYINESDPMSAGEVIYSNGEWYTRSRFKKLGGYETQGDWRKAFRHFGQVIYGLMTKHVVLTLSPPACKCAYCPKLAPKETSYTALKNAKLMEEYGERPPDGVYAIPIESGPMRGWLCLEYLNTDSPRHCIYSHGEWFKRHTFKNLGGYKRYNTWQDGIWHFGKLINTLLNKNVLTISPPSCKCDFCIESPAPIDDSPAALRDAKLVKEYGERPPDGVYAVPIESGPKKGWLCLEYIDDSSPSVTRECIYSHGQWFVCSKFKKLGGFNFGNWDDGIWHFGQLMKGLLKFNVMTISPPCCKCDFCIGNSEYTAKSQPDLTVKSPSEKIKHSPPKKSYSTLIRSLKEYGERPPDGVFAVPIESGPKKGWLCLEYLDDASPHASRECIYSHGEWYTRCKFKNLGGFENRGEWKKAVYHFGQSMWGLMKNNVITVSPPSCKCDFCIDNDTKLLREYGERPQDVQHSLPVECGPKRGWMCLEYISEASPQATGECIYYRGEWYTRTHFKKLGGCESSGDWKASIKHLGRSMKWMLNNNVVTISPPSCSCEQCKDNEPIPSGSAAKVKKEAREDDLDTASYVGSAQRPDDIDDALTYTTGNDHPQLAIQVECADITAWLCVGMIASTGQKTKECVLLKGRLLAPFSYMKECGFGGGNWKLNIKHFGESVSLLMADGILTTSPPACGCDICEQDVSISQRYVCLQCNKLFTTRAICKEHIGNLHNPDPIPDAASSDGFESASVVDSSPRVDTPTEPFDEYQYGPKLILSVECGAINAWLCLSYIERFSKSTEECILFNGEMVLPTRFVELCLGQKVESEWKSHIKHDGRTLDALLDKRTIAMIPPACHCDVCNSNHSENGQAFMCSQCFAKFGKFESCEEHMAVSHRPGERPEGPEFCVPVESGPYKGWMCVGRIKEDEKERTGPCILLNGQWLTPPQFAFIAGKYRGAWQSHISHGGLTIRQQIRVGSITASPPACHCKKCKDANTVCTTYICGLCDSTFTSMENYRNHVTLIHNQVLPPGHREASTSPSELMGATPAKRPRLASPSQPSPPATSTLGVPVAGSITTLSPPAPAQTIVPRPNLATTIKDLTAEEIFAKLMERQAVFVCTCGIVFRDRVLFYLHRGMHSSDNPYKCSFCGHVAPNWYDFNSHTFTHSSS